MFVVDEKLRQAALADNSNLLFQLTGMNPGKPETVYALYACTSHSPNEKKNNAEFSGNFSNLIKNNILSEQNK